MLAAWLALFQWHGNSTLGYVRTPSLFVYLYDSFSGTAGSNEHNLLDSEEGFGFLIPLVVLVILWLKRRQLLALESAPWWPGLLVVGSGALVHIVGYRVQQPRISVVGLFTGIYGLCGLTWGRAWLRASFFPFILFLFCIPLGSLAVPITFRLRVLVTQLVAFVSHYILAIDVIVEGTGIKDPTNRYHYEIAAACSGIRSLIATVALSVIFGFFSLQKSWKRLAMIASAFPLAVLGNLLRMLAIVIAAELGGQQWGNRVHDGGPGGIFSLLPYVPAFAGLLLLEHLLRERPVPVRSGPLLAAQT